MSFWHQTDGALVRMAAQQANDVRAARNAAMNVDDILTRWEQLHPQPGMTTQAAREWARLHVTLDSEPLAKVLRQVYAIGTALGNDISLAAYSRARLYVKAPSADEQQGSLNTDWATWTPGGNAAALLVEPPNGLRRLLEQTKATIKGMNDSQLDMIGTALADGLTRGLASAELAANLRSIADSPRHALTIAQTEMHRALSVQATANYSEWGVTQIQWGASDTDDECADNDDEGPVDIGHVFSSGDTEPPAHPNCRCWIEPVVEGNVDMPEDAAIEMAANAMIVKSGVPGPLEVERAISRLAILPNPAHPEIANPDKFVESPWQIIEPPQVDPNIWDDAEVSLVRFDSMTATDAYLKRKNVRKHIESMGSSLLPYRSYALILVKDGRNIIIDGHHRLMALWLLGLEEAPVWKVKD